MGTTLFSFVVVLGVLIFAHELGHFLMARRFGVGVEKFSLGFGPRIFGRRVGITDYRLSAIPLGGYVKMVGEEPDAELTPEEIPLSFTHKPVWQRFLIVAAGPLANLLLAVVIFFFIFWISGLYELVPVVGEVQEGSPALAAGVQPGDRIEAVDGRSVARWEEMAEAIAASGGRPITLRLQRGGEVRSLVVQPERKTARNLFGEEVERQVIGVSASGEVAAREVGLLGALKESVVQTYKISELTVLSIVKLIQGRVSAKTLGGPIMIAEMAGQQAREGAANLIFFIALISINLAVLNILPIPVLDGGHLLFFLLEALRGRPLSLRVRERAQQAGILILVALMIYVFYNDISRILLSS
jgi:regulator of sigma E protease